jgi:predicted Holliday junction resolvase-like endonuclease
MSLILTKNQNLMRKIYGVCPCCGELFRLSDIEIHVKQAREPKQTVDWLDKIEMLEEKVGDLEERIQMKEQAAREVAREAGRIAAAKALVAAVKKVDHVFSPAKLDVQDSKVMFHPVDFIVFDGMQRQAVNRIVLLDRKPQNRAHSDLQKNVQAAVRRKAVEWKTIHVSDDGVIEHR